MPNGATNAATMEVFPAGDVPALAMKALLPARVGDCSSTKTDFNQVRSSGIYRFAFTACLDRFDMLTVDGSPRKVAVVTVSEEGQDGNVYAGKRTYLYDVATNALVGASLAVSRGTPSNAVDWKARRVSGP